MKQKNKRTSFTEEEEAQIAKVRGTQSYWTWLHDIAMEKCENDGRSRPMEKDGRETRNIQEKPNPRVEDKPKGRHFIW